MTSPRLMRSLRTFRSDIGGANAVEFALILPLMLLLLFGGYQMNEALSAYRKMTITTRTVVDLATQPTAISSSNMSTILNASAQVMVPFSTTNLTIVLSEFTMPASGNQATVTWSTTLNGTALTQGSKVTLPTGLCQPSASILRADITYTFTPAFAYKATGPIVMRDSVYMSPRQSPTVAYPSPS